MSTVFFNDQTAKRDWFIVDAEGLVLGRLASEIARRLRGKHKPEFTPNMDVGDYIVVINAEKVKATGNKLADKVYWSHSQHPGGIKSVTLGKMLADHPERAIEKAVKGMLPHNKLGRQQIKKLKVYTGADHPHAAQNPQPYEISQVAQ